MNSIIRVTAIDCQIASVNETATEIATLLNAERQNPKKQAEKCAELFANLNANAMELVAQGLVQATERKDGTREVKQKELNEFVTKLFRGYLTGKSAKKYADTCNAIRGKYPDVWDNLTLGKLNILATFESKNYLEKMPKGLSEFLVWLGDYSQKPIEETWNNWDEIYTQSRNFMEFTKATKGENSHDYEVAVANCHEIERQEPERPVPPNDPTFTDTMQELAIYALDSMSDSEVRKVVSIYMEEIGMKNPKDGTTEGAEGTTEGAEGTTDPKPKTQAELKAEALTALQAYAETLDKMPVCFKKSLEELAK